jgi:hypothetical protein
MGGMIVVDGDSVDPGTVRRRGLLGVADTEFLANSGGSAEGDAESLLGAPSAPTASDSRYCIKRWSAPA